MCNNNYNFNETDRYFEIRESHYICITSEQYHQLPSRVSLSQCITPWILSMFLQIAFGSSSHCLLHNSHKSLSLTLYLAPIYWHAFNGVMSESVSVYKEVP